MICTVSTVKDQLPNVQQWVRRNLTNGVDHMIVFLDAPAPRVRAFLDEHEHVTCVRTDQEWWRGERPQGLNDRQVVNANVAKAALAHVGGVEWVFHIDGDEVLAADRDELGGLGDAPGAHVRPHEAVSRWQWDGPVTHFKRLLGRDELALLHVLGVVDEPRNAHYFRGHTSGKTGMRPALEPWFMAHHVVTSAAGGRHSRVPVPTCTSTHLLHYESFDGQEFVRKWRGLMSSGPTVRVRDSRAPVQRAMSALLALELLEDDFLATARQVFERTQADDVDTLGRLGLLVPAAELMPSGQQPRALPASTRDDLAEVLATVARHPKRAFAPQWQDRGAVARALGG